MARLLVAGVMLATLATTSARADAFDMGPGDAQTGVDGSDQAAVPEPTDVVPDLTEGSSGPQLFESFGLWDRLAECESNQRWWIADPPYYGGLQEDLVFWRRHGGLAYADRPDHASREAQIAVARVGQSVQGWGAWPVCSKRLGLR